MLDIATEKSSCRDKTPGMPPDAKIEAGRTKTDAGLEHHLGRQRRPTDETAPPAPADPGGPPLRARHPGPAAVVLVVKPASVVKGNRTPGIRGNPGPAIIIGEHPVTERIGPPILRHVRIPNPAIGFKLAPVAVRGQLVVEKAEVDANRGVSRYPTQQRQSRRIGRIESDVHQQPGGDQSQQYFRFHATPRIQPFAMLYIIDLKR